MKKLTLKNIALLLIAISLTAPVCAQDADTQPAADTLKATPPGEPAEAATSVALVPEQLLASATAAYEAGRYGEAITDYEQLAQQCGTSASLNYNLGNAYFKDKQYARAILHYERALLQDPSDEDAANNLAMAQANTVDKIESIEPIIFAQWSRSVRNSMSCDAWAWLSICLFILFIVGLFLYFFLHNSRVRRLGFFGGVIALVLCLVAINYAGQQYDNLMVRDHAIIMSPTVTVRSSPAESGTQLFTLHEGTKVKVRSSLGQWLEIELADGNVGWIPDSDLETI
jgi:tetratricopeptide (TPR) repeat protein